MRAFHRSTHCPSRSCSSANKYASRVRRQPTQLGSRRHACGRCLNRVACSSFPAGDMPTARRTNVMTCRITRPSYPGRSARPLAGGAAPLPYGPVSVVTHRPTTRDTSHGES